MDGFTIIDGVVAIVIVVSALLAYSRGLVREVLAIGAWVVAAILAFMFAPDAGRLVANVPAVGDFIAGNCELMIVAGFTIVLAVGLVVFSIFTPLLSSFIQRTALDAIDQTLGFLFGVVRGVLLVAVAFFLYDVILSSQDIPQVENSRSAVVFSRFTTTLQEQDPEAALGWVTGRYADLIATCDA
jgi:membrane protein required for colicin V production